MSPETTRALLRGSVLTKPLYTQAETHSALARRGDSIRTTPQQRIVARLDISLRGHLSRDGLPRPLFLGGVPAAIQPSQNDGGQPSSHPDA